MYALSEVTKRFGDTTVLDVGNLEIQSGLIHALLGPNGAGKTTLLRTLAFLDYPTTGEIWFDNQAVIFSESRLLDLRKRVVLVDQNPIMFSTTVYKNLEYGLKIRKVPKIERKQRVLQALKTVNLAHKAGCLAQTLSGGEKQRVALARAFALNPKVILCDEPTANVDQQNRAIVMELLRDINISKQISIIFATHDRFLASGLADQTISLDSGRPTLAFCENIFRAKCASRFGKSVLIIEEQLIVPRLNPEHNPGTIRVLINPEQIEICDKKDHVDELTLSGSILHISYDMGRIRLQVDSQPQLIMSLSQEEYNSKNPRVGQKVDLYIPDSAIGFL